MKLMTQKSGLPANHNMTTKRRRYRCTSVRLCSTFSLSALGSFHSTAGATSNTRDTGSQVLSAPSGPSQATLTMNSSSPSDNRGETLVHSTTGDCVQVGALPAVPLRLD